MIENRLEVFLKNIRAKGRYTFTFDELKMNFNLSDKTIRKIKTHVRLFLLLPFHRSLKPVCRLIHLLLFV
jgi:hypothetical protein